MDRRPVPGRNRRDGGGGPRSALPGLLSAYTPAAVWDAGFGRTLVDGGTTVSAWADQSGAGYHLTQPGDAALQATPVTTAGGKPALRFAGGQWLKCDALGPLVSGDAHPYWFAAAIEGVTRDATARTLMSLGNTSSLLKLVNLRPNNSATQTRHYRLDDGGGSEYNLFTTTGRTSGIIISRHVGTHLRCRWGTSTDSDASIDNLDLQMFTIGADRLGTVPTISAYFVGDILGAAFGAGLLDDTAEAALYAAMVLWAGY